MIWCCVVDCGCARLFVAVHNYICLFVVVWACRFVTVEGCWLPAA